MQRETLISIIIPVYNVASYLERCIKSVIDQSYKNLQIILVDDGSTDGSGDISDRLAEADPRIEVLHKANGGASDARNMALDVIKGTYVGFIDADDYIEPYMYEDMYEQAVKYDADIVSCGYYKEESNCSRSLYADYNDVKILNRLDAFRGLFLFNYVSEGNWAKLVRRELFDNVRYKVGIHTEDILLLTQLLDKADKVVCIPKAYYHYIIRENSSSNAKHNPHILDALSTMDYIEELITSRYSEVLAEMQAYCTVWRIDTFSRVYHERKYYLKELRMLKKLIKEKYSDMHTNIYLDKTYKFKLLGIIYNMYGLLEWILSCWFSIKSVGRKR